MSEIVEKTELERNPGFINAEGGNGVSYATANQAFYAYLNAAGLPKNKANKAKFKEWLAKAKESGQLDKVVATGTAKVETAVNDKKQELQDKADQLQTNKTTEQPETNDAPTKFKLPMAAKIGIVIAVIGLVSWGVYAYTKKKQAKA